MSESIEYRTLMKCRSQMRIGFKNDINDLASSFNNSGLIGEICCSNVCQVGGFLTDKVEEFVQGVMDSVSLRAKKNYEKMMKALVEMKKYDDLVYQLDEEYKKQGGTVAYAVRRVYVAPVVDSKDRIWKIEISTLKYINLIRYYNSDTGAHKMLRIMEVLAPDWEEVGDILDFNNYELRAIRNVGTGTTPIQCLRRVFNKWMDRGDEGALACNWQGIYNLLKKAMKNKHAKELKTAIESEYSDLRNNYEDAPEEGGVVGASRKQPASQPPAQPVAQAAAIPVAAPGAPARHPRKDKDKLAEWLEIQGVDPDDIACWKGNNVNEMVFMMLKPGHKFCAGISEATMMCLEMLQGELKDTQ